MPTYCLRVALAATWIIGILFLLDGIMEIALGLQLGRENRKSKWLFAGGTFSLLFGAIIFYQPLIAAWMVGMLVGIRLIVKGIEQIVPSSAGAKPDIERRAA
jgi:uncharacterized membrane protein HdeD (DUF308 family)